jgi:hypothetical protein
MLVLKIVANLMGLKLTLLTQDGALILAIKKPADAGFLI